MSSLWFTPYVQPEEFLLSKNVDVALWLVYPMFTNQMPLDEVCDLVVVDEPFMEEFQEFKQHHSSPGFSYLPVNELLELWILVLETVNVVAQFERERKRPCDINGHSQEKDHYLATLLTSRAICSVVVPLCIALC